MYWKLADGVTIVPLATKTQSPVERLALCRQLRSEGYGKVRIILNCTAAALLSELISPTVFQCTDSYYYVYQAPLIAHSSEWISQQGCVLWNQTHLLKDGEKLCGDCFLLGAIAEQKSCSHGIKKRKHVEHTGPATGKKWYACNFECCEYKSAQSGNLARHKLTHTGQKSHLCDFAGCDFKCTTSGGLTIHMRTHTGEKRHACDFENCDYKCTTSAGLTMHKRSHTNEKPYTCCFKDCAYRCTNSSNLSRHKRSHTNDKPYACSFKDCTYRCTNSGSLTKHKRSHTNEKPYACEHCGYSFSNWSNRNTHMQMHERQAQFIFKCIMQDGGTQLWEQGDVECTIRCETAQHMEYHVQRNHTTEGIGAKLESETKLARFFDANEVSFSRDWTNRLNFKACKNIEGKSTSARPDFYLLAESARLGAAVLVGNDEFGHRRYPCDLQRTFNITQSMEQTDEFRGVRLLYVRFNPHFFQKGSMYFDSPLATSHMLLLSTIRKLQPSDLKDGLNLFFVNYDRDEKGNLQLFVKAKEEDNDFGTVLAPCVIGSI